MQIALGYELLYDVPQPMLLTVTIHYSRASATGAQKQRFPSRPTSRRGGGISNDSGAER